MNSFVNPPPQKKPYHCHQFQIICIRSSRSFVTLRDFTVIWTGTNHHLVFSSLSFYLMTRGGKVIFRLLYSCHKHQRILLLHAPMILKIKNRFHNPPSKLGVFTCVATFTCILLGELLLPPHLMAVKPSVCLACVVTLRPQPLYSETVPQSLFLYPIALYSECWVVSPILLHPLRFSLALVPLLPFWPVDAATCT